MFTNEQSDPWSELVRLLVTALSSLSDVLAVGLGGSMWQDSRDVYSDADVFVIIRGDAEDALHFARTFPNCFTHPGEVVAQTPLNYKVGYGLCRSYVYGGFPPATIFFNSPSMFHDESPMRVNTVPLYDPHGVLREAVALQKSVNQTPDHGLHLKRALDDLICKLLSSLRFLHRGDLLPFFNRFGDVRNAMCAVVRVHLLGEPFIRDRGDRRLIGILSDPHSQAIFKTFPGSTLDLVEGLRVVRAVLSLIDDIGLTHPGISLLEARIHDLTAAKEHR